MIGVQIQAPRHCISWTPPNRITSSILNVGNVIEHSFIQEPATIFPFFRRDFINSVPEVFPSQGVDICSLYVHLNGSIGFHSTCKGVGIG
jgi:hypothetical protein